MKNILGEIVANKKLEIERQKRIITTAEMEKRFLQSEVIPFHSLKGAITKTDTAIIAEFKRRSPGKGWINRQADINLIAKSYEQSGAAALSVLSDNDYFGGSLRDLRRAVQHVEIPVMRKDFIIDEYQLFEAKLAGASAVLMIAAVITLEESKRITLLANQLQLDLLLELHDESEIDYITSDNMLIGVNNRNLDSFVTDIQKSFRMATLLPDEAIWVSESGISDSKVVRELKSAGYRGFLIGEYFMRSTNPGESLKRFINEVG